MYFTSAHIFFYETLTLLYHAFVLSVGSHHVPKSISKAQSQPDLRKTTEANDGSGTDLQISAAS